MKTTESIRQSARIVEAHAADLPAESQTLLTSAARDIIDRAWQVEIARDRLERALAKIHANAAESPEWIRAVIDEALVLNGRGT